MTDEIIPGRYYREYKCMGGHTWSTIDAGPNPNPNSIRKKKCTKCKSKVQVNDHRPLKKSDIPDDTRMYGKFTCSNPNCENGWSSANAWKGYKQGCRECKTYVLTWDLYFLRHNEDSNGRSTKNHQVGLCKKCEELGHSCVTS
jgi:hypothetical protein